MLYFNTSEQYNISCTLPCESDLCWGRLLASSQNQSQTQCVLSPPLRIRFWKRIHTSDVNFKVCVGWFFFLNHNLEGQSIINMIEKLQSNHTIHWSVFWLLKQIHVMRHKSFWSGSIFSIFSVMHIYTPISPTIFMKPDSPKTKHKKQLGKKSKLKQQCGIILSFIHPLHKTPPLIYYSNVKNTEPA